MPDLTRRAVLGSIAATCSAQTGILKSDNAPVAVEQNDFVRYVDVEIAEGDPHHSVRDLLVDTLAREEELEFQSAMLAYWLDMAREEITRLRGQLMQVAPGVTAGRA